MPPILRASRTEIADAYVPLLRAVRPLEYVAVKDQEVEQPLIYSSRTTR